MPARAASEDSPPTPGTPVTVRNDRPLESVAAADWNALVSNAGEVQPFLDHAFLAALHESGCAVAATGWRPRYLTAWRGARLVGALPLYAKAHSYGEYGSMCGLVPSVLVGNSFYLFVFYDILYKCEASTMLGQIMA